VTHDLPEFESEYMEVLVYSTTGKTYRLNILSKSRGDELGVIKWYGPWRQYCFYPEPETIFSRGCLADIATYLEKIMECWRNDL